MASSYDTRGYSWDRCDKVEAPKIIKLCRNQGWTMIDPEMMSPIISPVTAFNLKNESRCSNIRSVRSKYNVINAGFLQTLAHTRLGCRPFHFHGQTSVEIDPHTMEASFLAHGQHATVYRAYRVMQIGGRTRGGAVVLYSLMCCSFIGLNCQGSSPSCRKTST